MPTGYTAAIKDGISFEEFTMSCAKAFGACVTMRDDSTGIPIPEKFEPSDYDQKKLVELRCELEQLCQFTSEDTDKIALAEWKSEEERRLDSLKENADLRNKYETMLAQVKAWIAPTPDHDGLHKFMCEQITESIKWDCSEDYYREPVARLTGQQWLNKRKDFILQSIDYHTKSNADEIERVNSRNEWVKALRDSL